MRCNERVKFDALLSRALALGFDAVATGHYAQIVEVPDPEGPMGLKGLGEHVLIPTAPAILNAIRHATGARVTKLPALPHRVLAAIREARG